MTTAKKTASSTNNSTTVITAPKIEKAWSDLVVQTTTSEQGAIRACLELAKQMKTSQLSIRDIQKVIKATGLESPFVKVSHVEGLPSMLALQKVAGFSALPLAKQLSTATASYKLLGAGIGEQMPNLEALETEIARERKTKNEKSAEPKPAKEAKSPKTNADTLRSVLAFIQALDFEAITETEADIVTEIYTVIEAKTLQLA